MKRLAMLALLLLAAACESPAAPRIAANTAPAVTPTVALADTIVRLASSCASVEVWDAYVDGLFHGPFAMDSGAHKDINVTLKPWHTLSVTRWSDGAVVVADSAHGGSVYELPCPTSDH